MAQMSAFVGISHIIKVQTQNNNRSEVQNDSSGFSSSFKGHSEKYVLAYTNSAKNKEFPAPISKIER